MSERKGGCPCEHVEPCGPNCSCARPQMSGGCRRCCRYGSEEQQRRAAEHLAAQADEVARIKAATDGRPESFLKLLCERAHELARDYPYVKHDAFEWLWAITSTLEGTELARQDWEKEATRLKAENASLKEISTALLEACRLALHDAPPACVVEALVKAIAEAR